MWPFITMPGALPKKKWFNFLFPKMYARNLKKVSDNVCQEHFQVLENVSRNLLGSFRNVSKNYLKSRKVFINFLKSFIKNYKGPLKFPKGT
jgi:hypothetical protein